MLAGLLFFTSLCVHHLFQLVLWHQPCLIHSFFLSRFHFSVNLHIVLCVPQSRSPRHSQSTQSGLADQAAKLSFASAESLETMSEADMPTGFNRMNRFRQSLPLSRSASQNKLRSPGNDFGDSGIACCNGLVALEGDLAPFSLFHVSVKHCAVR